MIAHSSSRPAQGTTLTGQAFRRVVIGIGDDGGAAAIGLARALAAGDAAFMLTRIHVEPALVLGAPVKPSRSATAQALDLLRAARTELGLPCEIVVEDAHCATTGLHRIAEREEADLLVVGATHGDLGELPGTDGCERRRQHVLPGAPCAVAIAPGSPEERHVRFKRIGVGFRPTEPGRHALDVARALAGARDADLHAMTVVPVVPNPWLGPAAGTLRGIAQISGALAELAQEDLDAIDGVVDHVSEGDPVDQLQRFSRTVDLLVLGTRSGGPLRRIVAGSVTSALSVTAHCPVLVVGCHDEPASAR